MVYFKLKSIKGLIIADIIQPRNMNISINISGAHKRRTRGDKKRKYIVMISINHKRCNKAKVENLIFFSRGARIEKR